MEIRNGIKLSIRKILEKDNFNFDCDFGIVVEKGTGKNSIKHIIKDVNDEVLDEVYKFNELNSSPINFVAKDDQGIYWLDEVVDAEWGEYNRNLCFIYYDLNKYIEQGMIKFYKDKKKVKK